MLTRFIPWKFLLRRFATSQGFVDPLALLSQFNRFAKPAELVAPTELMRAGAKLHARGLINSQAIQHNLDWVWPFWVARQFDPMSMSFVPRAFALTHINLTHRNWTAVGVPGYDAMPIVDPHGLVTPLYDAWSLDFWLVDNEGNALLPPRLADMTQLMGDREGLSVETTGAEGDSRLRSTVWVSIHDGHPYCHMELRGRLARDGVVTVALRPFNPEGVSFVDKIELTDDSLTWRINGRNRVVFGERPAAHVFSHYHGGDVLGRIVKRDSLDRKGTIRCPVGMATAAALFEAKGGEDTLVRVQVPLPRAAGDPRPKHTRSVSTSSMWNDALEGACRIDIPSGHLRFLFENALRTLALHAPDDVYAGPYTYKRFWFRDAVLIGHAMYTVNMVDRAQDILDAFPTRQTTMGYFLSQEGEWDSNGQVLWLARKLLALRGDDIERHWVGAIRRADDWIRRKRLPPGHDSPHAGLMPPGFSAEHLGPNDYYYWDDYWSAAGLFASAELFDTWGMTREAQHTRDAGKGLMDAVERSLATVEQRLGRMAIPAAPDRRLDSGSLAVSYPLRLCEPDDPWVLGTADFLLHDCMVNDALFHDISHAGLNPYLTLHLAQVLLRAGDRRFWPLMQAIGSLSSPTGNWPEAVHPRLGTGCMGDGQHVWAAAEWLMMMRSCFVREEERSSLLVLCSGIPQKWLIAGTTLTFGPTRTAFGPVRVRVDAAENAVTVGWKGQWQPRQPSVEVRLPWTTVRPEPGASQVTVSTEGRTV